MKHIKLAVILLVLSVGLNSAQVNAKPKHALRALDEALNQAFPNDRALSLVAGENFEAELGTVIFVSRAEGRRRMVALARAGADELSMLYLPGWRAWITVTTTRAAYETRMDNAYVEAALMIEPYVELWHTHNNKSESDPNKTERNKLSRMWAVPSGVDLLQLYEYAREIPGSKPVGVVASIHGTTTYWSDDPSWGLLLYQRFAVRREAEQLRQEAGEISVSRLPQLARSHKGFIKLRFMPAK